MRKAGFIIALCVCCLLFHSQAAFAEEANQTVLEDATEETESSETEAGSEEQEPIELPVPNAVTGLKVQYEDNGTAAKLTWAVSENASSYRIYRKNEKDENVETGSYEELTATEQTAYYDDTINADELYFYQVIPENAAGVQGMAATVKLIPAPHLVEGLHTTCQTEQKVLLEWNKSKFAEKYLVYRQVGTGAYKQLEETSKTSYKDASIAWGKQYHYKVIAVNESGTKGEAGKITFKPAQAVNVKSQKYSYSQMEKDMKELAALYSDYCTLTSIGKSVQGRKIYDFAIGSPNAEKSMLVVCTLHAREYICSVVAMQQIEYYLRNYNKKISGTKPAEALSDMQIHYIVMANPDGVSISQSRNSRWKANANGVDLNRNFPATPFKVGGKKGQEGYSGPRAFSEPESQALADYTKKLKKEQGLAGILNYHAMGQIVFGKCDSKALAKDTKTMYDIAKKLTGYRSSAGYQAATPPSGGGYRDYVMYNLGIPSITIEMGSTTAPCAYREYSSAFQKNRYVVLKIAEAL